MRLKTKKLVCLMPVRNEDWVLGLSARAVLRWVDHLVVLDHASVDQTPAVIAAVQLEFPGRITVLGEEDPEWQEMRHRQRMLSVARDLGASHIVMVDADEVLSGNLLPIIRDVVFGAPAGQTMELPWLCLRGSIDTVMTSGVWGDNTVCMAFRDSGKCHWKARSGYDFHHRHPMGRPFIGYAPISREDGGLMHLQFVNERRLRAKQALYKMVEVVRWPGRDPVVTIDERYNEAVYGSERAAIADVPVNWWESYADLLGHLRTDAKPWQEAECARLWDQHGPARFRGLDLFGVVPAITAA